MPVLSLPLEAFGLLRRFPLGIKILYNANKCATQVIFEKKKKSVCSSMCSTSSCTCIMSRIQYFYVRRICRQFLCRMFIGSAQFVYLMLFHASPTSFVHSINRPRISIISSTGIHRPLHTPFSTNEFL